MCVQKQTLEDFFAATPRAALAFSGGVDSSYLLYAACACGADVRPYYVSSAFQPAFELADARRLAAQLGVELRVLPLDVLADETVRANPENRCYYCKRRVFGAIAAAAAADGYTVLFDGTNASDQAGDRPGMRALRELSVRSPLRLCGLTKADVRRLSQEAGLFTWDKPSYACLATRVPAGTPLDAATLRAVEQAEDALMARGYRNVRARVRGAEIWLEVLPEQLPQAEREQAELARCVQAAFPGSLFRLKVRQNVT